MIGLTSAVVVGQSNLVPNSSFEEYPSCPIGIAEAGNLLHWYNPTNASPDLFSTCSINPNSQIPENFAGFQYPRTDSSYVGIALARPDTTTYREYLGVELTNTLQPDSFYCISFFVSAPDSVYLFTDNLGIHFSTNLISQSSLEYLDLEYHIRNPEFHFLDDTQHWVEISGIYKATGGEKFLTIGNFSSFSEVNLYGDTNSIAYIYLDDISVISCTPTDSTDPPVPVDVPLISVNPNPATEFIRIYSEIPDGSDAVFQLFDVQGKKIAELPLDEGRNTLTHYLPGYAAGLYGWRLVVNGEVAEKGKLIVIR